MQIISYLNSETQLFLTIIFALIFGSFASLVSYRLARKQPIALTRSKCANCQTNLKFYNLIPIFSWLFQKGKCSFCHQKISIRYPIIELGFLIIFLLIFFILNQQINFKMILYFLIASSLIIMVITDLEEYFIPDSVQYFFAFFAIILLIHEKGNYAAIKNLDGAFLYAGFGLALYYFFFFTAKIEALGIDDIKFFFIAGLLFGSKVFLTFMLLNGIFGILFGLIWQKITKEQLFPFAPAICLTTLFCLLFPKFDVVELIGSLLF